MITGDNPLTACHVGSVLHFTRKNTPILIFDEPANEESDWCWRSVDKQLIVKFGDNPRQIRDSVKSIISKYDLCLTGVGYDYLEKHNEVLLNEIIAQVRIFARMSPKQKEFVINRMKALGLTTLMVGDGTNDVGALKHAQVGVALLSHPFDATKESLEEKNQARAKKISEARELSKEIRDPSTAKKQGHGTRRSDAPPGSRNAPTRPNNISNAQAKLDQMLKELQEEENQLIRLGDASVAAPFTSKFTSIQSSKLVLSFK
jgi:cation-transporting ATPase 13A1